MARLIHTLTRESSLVLNANRQFDMDPLACTCIRTDCLRKKQTKDEEELLIVDANSQTNSCLCRDWLPFIPARYILAVMMFLGSFVLYVLRVNLSVAVVAMTNQTADKPNAGGANDTSSCTPTAPVFFWDNNQQGRWRASCMYWMLSTDCAVNMALCTNQVCCKQHYVQTVL